MPARPASLTSCRSAWTRPPSVPEDRLQQADGAGLVERLVEVAALGGLDAGRAAVGAVAGVEGLEGGVEVAVGGLVAQVGDAGAAGVAVVDGDRGQAGVGLVHRRHAADVPAVAD